MPTEKYASTSAASINMDLQIKCRVPTSLSTVGRAVIFNRKSAVENMGTLNIKGYCS